MFRRLLFLNCVLTDFAGFIVIFAVSRSLAERDSPQWYLGFIGAGLSLSAGFGSIAGGWLAHRFDARAWFLSGAVLVVLSTLACGLTPTTSPWFVPVYWLLGIGLGCFYPPLVGWLNQGDNLHRRHRGVSRTLVLFCISWNAGLMCGQLTAGSLFSLGPVWTFGAALAIAVLNLAVALAATARVPAAMEDAAPNPAPGDDPGRAQLASSFKRLSWIANLGGNFGGSMVMYLLPGLAVAIDVTPENHGRLLGGWRAVAIVTYLVLHASSFWHYRIAVALTSQLLAAVGLMCIAAADSGLTLLLGLALLGQLQGFNYFSGLFYSTLGSSDENRSFAAGIHEATLAVGMSVGTLIGGAMGTAFNLRIPYVLAAFVLLGLSGVQYAAWRRWGLPAKRPAESIVPTAEVAAPVDASV